jgi:hypothetical protein
MQVSRFISERQETDIWAYTPRDVAGGVARFGRLDELRDLKRGGAIELRPFALGQLRRRNAGGDTVAQGYDARGSAGLDLKWHVTQDLTFDAAIFPDFAQVEADQLILNLTNFETFFPEKRPIFLEGGDAFATPLTVFYSRRIGSAPAAPTIDSMTQKLVDIPEAAVIYGAGKLVGRLDNRWTVGALSAITARNQVLIQQNADGTRTPSLVAPTTAFNVMRVKRDLGSNAYVGVIGTGATSLDEPTGAPRTCPDTTPAAIGQRCFHDGYLGGVDGFWRSPSGDYVAGGQLVESLIEGGATPKLRDGTVIGAGDHATGGWARIAKEGGKHVIWSAEYTGLGRKLDYNDLGFLPRQNLHELKTSVAYRTLDPGRLTIDTTTGLDVDARRSLTGVDLGQTYELYTRWHLRGFYTALLALDFATARFDDREVGDGTALERAGYVGGRLELTTDPRRPLAGSLASQTQFIGGGAFATAVQAGLTLHFIPQLELDVAPQVTYTRGEPRFAEQVTPGDNFFGRLEATSAGATLHASYTFMPRLTLQTYAQLFLAAGHYSDFWQITMPAGSKVRLANLTATNPGMLADTDPNPDFEQAALNINVVLRWEYRLGSTLFLVYSRSQVPSVELIQGRTGQLNLGAVSRGAAVDVILLKLSYWWAG